MHVFSYVHAFNALSGTCIVCAAGEIPVETRQVPYYGTTLIMMRMRRSMWKPRPADGVPPH